MPRATDRKIRRIETYYIRKRGYSSKHAKSTAYAIANARGWLRKSKRTRKGKR